MAVVVVNEVEFGIVNFGRPLEGLNNAIVRCGDRAEGRIGIRRANVAGGAEDLADVFRQVVAAGEQNPNSLIKRNAKNSAPPCFYVQIPNTNKIATQ